MFPHPPAELILFLTPGGFMDTFVTLEETEVLRVRADMTGKGPGEAFRLLESKLRTVKGRRFYGTIRILPEGEEYFATVVRLPADRPEELGLEVGTIPGGLYVRRKVLNWERVIAEGRIKSISEELARSYQVDSSRPELEYYRSAKELHLLIPVTSTDRAAPGRGAR